MTAKNKPNQDIPKNWHKMKEEFELRNEAEDESPLDDEKSDFVGETLINSEVALDHPSYKALEEKLTLAEQKGHEAWEKMVRTTAEAENRERRFERDLANAHRFSIEKFATSLLPVIDSLEQALQLAAQGGPSSMVEGLELTMKLLLDVLEKNNIRQINPMGELFNPQEHEAMSLQETTEVPHNTIVAVFQRGYKLHERVIRPARIVVAKNK